MKDYYDAVPPEDEPMVKECPSCGGRGHDFIEKCVECQGTGEVPMTWADYLSELDYQIDSKLDDEMFSRRRV